MVPVVTAFVAKDIISLIPTRPRLRNYDCSLLSSLKKLCFMPLGSNLCLFVMPLLCFCLMLITLSIFISVFPFQMHL
ncbi:uncharacterized protein LOC120712602 [Panicum virgatum]|uniref:uncharacterized protein LOC120712602 n=1 Tax=Panicum virgatum TaxID=38727 RepID=UPI0019D63CA7|nr:uncharacterized protein LOC120712602 [Panicum virgatum]